MLKYSLKKDFMNESDLQRVCNFKKYPRDSSITTNKGLVNLDNGQMGGSHWCAFTLKITNHTNSIVSEENLINFYLINYINQ